MVTPLPNLTQTEKDTVDGLWAGAHGTPTPGSCEENQLAQFKTETVFHYLTYSTPGGPDDLHVMGVGRRKVSGNGFTFDEALLNAAEAWVNKMCGTTYSFTTTVIVQ